MQGPLLDKGGRLQVEEIARVPVFCQRHEAQEARQMQQQDDVEIGISLLRLVQPSQGVDQILEQRRILLFMTQRPIQELAEEQSHRCLGRFKRQLAPGMPQADLARPLQVQFGPVFPDNFHHRERLPYTGFDACTPGPREPVNKRHGSRGFCKDVCYHLCVVEAERMKDDTV